MSRRAHLLHLPRKLSMALRTAVAAGLFLAMFNEYFDPSKCVAIFQDNTYLLLPLLHHASRCFTHGEYPYWIESIMGGLALYNSPQFSAEYPFYLLRLPLYRDPVSTMWTVHWLTILHLGLFSLTTYVMLRCLRLASLPAAFGAALVASLPNTRDYAGWLHVIAPYSWFPLVVTGAALMPEPKRRPAAVVVGGTAAGLLALAAPSHALIHAGFAVAAFYVHAIVRCLRRGERREAVKVTRGYAAMAVLGFVIGAPALLPSLMAMKDSIRFNGDYPPILGRAGIPFEYFVAGQFRPADLAGVLLPVEIPTEIGRPFMGLAAALFALLGLAGVRRNPVVVPLAFIALFGLLSATGNHLGVARINHLIPLINKIREPGRHLFLFLFGASALAAFGLQHVLVARRLLERKTLALVGVFVLLAALACTTSRAWVYPDSGRDVALGGLVGVTLVVAGRARRLRVAAAAGAVTIIWANLSYPLTVPPLEYGELFTAEYRRVQAVLREIAALPRVRDYRVVFFGDAAYNEQYWAMDASYYGLRTFQAYMNPLPFRQYDEVFQRYSLRHYYPMLGARYAVCTRCDAPVLADYRPLRSIAGYNLLVADEALPLYSLVGRVGGTYRDAEDFYGLVDAGAPAFAETVLLDVGHEAPVRQWLQGTDALHGRVDPLARSVNKMTVRVTADQPALLIVNQYHAREWHARADGTEVPIHRVNLNQMGVLVKAGVTEVRLEYRPRSYVALLWFQRGAVLALLALGAWRMTRRGGRAPSQSVPECAA